MPVKGASGQAAARAWITWPGAMRASIVSGTAKSSLIREISLIVAISVPACTTAPAEMLRSETHPEKGARITRSPIEARACAAWALA